jgi:1-deoxy-D-xylulose-5-phosphate reductoisomerase
MKKVVILGSTGSVGQNALKVIAKQKDAFKVVGLTAHSNAKLLAGQVNRFKPRLLALGDTSQYNELKRALKKPRAVLKGIEGISEIASMKEADIVLVAISGTSAILPVISAIRAKKQIAIANKESIVSAGKIIMNMARTRNVKIIPVDSEHSSIFQCINGRGADDIKKIFLMGTGGPLKDVSKSVFDKLKPSRILAHPVWKMGKKISVDSATMMNKGLEVIEASHLFNTSVSKISVLFHPEAVIHSMIEFADRNIIANLFYPDMRLPISYALNYPERRASKLPGVDFSKLKNISFQTPNRKKFPALGLCYEVARKGGTYPACLNSANEEAVRLYLEGKITLTGIVDIVKKVLSRHKNTAQPSLDEILYTDKWVKKEIKTLC